MQERVTGMYLAAFARPPGAQELAACLDFLGQGGPEAVMTHALTPMPCQCAAEIEFLLLRMQSTGRCG